MEIIIHWIGSHGIGKERILFEGNSLPVRKLLIHLRENSKEKVGAFVTEDLAIPAGSVILVNGRNILSLDGLDTELRDQDEVTFTVLVAGG